jgi:hypothetical protein
MESLLEISPNLEKLEKDFNEVHEFYEKFVLDIEKLSK